jgi:16S rRNA (adenine1518-N6/adenine1519-N6)-dimethyltransferase
LDYGAQVEAIELDRDLIEPLKARFADRPFKIHNADALTFDYHSLRGDAPLRIVGNLPYNISTPLLFHLFSYSHDLGDLHVMLQKEVAHRIAAEPGSGRYGRLSVMAQVLCQVDLLFEVGPESFKPAPKVESAVVRMTPHQSPPVDITSIDQFSKLVAQAFSQRRKTLRNSLKTVMDGDTIASLDIDPVRRAETLSLEEFARLANHLTP